MAPPRKFDHDEALRLFTEEGWTVAEIARRMGVSDAPVRLVCDPAYRERCRESSRRWGKRGACIDCGATIWDRPGYERCRECYVAKSRENLVHGSEGGYRRGCRCGPCREAATRARRQRRAANRDLDNAYQRAYKARRARAKAGTTVAAGGSCPVCEAADRARDRWRRESG